MRSKLTTLAELAGAGSVTFGFYGWHHWAGEVVGGVLAILGGYLFSDTPKPAQARREPVNP